MVTFLITAVAIIAGLAFVATANTWWAGKVRRNYLRSEYGEDPPLLDRLIKREIWPGMTRQHLLAAVGDPRAIDQVVENGRPAELYQYDRLGERYLLRVWLQDGVVTRFERDKS